MLTPTHALLSAALWARPERRAVSAAAVLGAIVPDMPIVAMLVLGRLAGLGDGEIWRVTYFEPGWQTVFAASHSLPLSAALAAVGLLARLPWLTVFAASAGLHALCDLPLHHDDGHAHLWPLSNWVYASPVSYWDPAHYGEIAAAAETVGGLILCAILWRRFRARAVRAAIALAGAGYALVPLFFLLTI